MLRFALGVCLTMSTVACAASDDGEDDVLREQLFATEFQLVDAIDEVDAIADADEVISAEAFPGTDDIEYEIVTVQGDDMIVRVLDGRTRRVVDEIRERADDRSGGDRVAPSGPARHRAVTSTCNPNACGCGGAEWPNGLPTVIPWPQ